MSTDQPYGPGAICSDCGHFAMRHGPTVRQGKRGLLPGCDCSDLVEKGIRKDACRCRGMLWEGQRWPRPWLSAPEGRERVRDAVRSIEWFDKDDA